MSKDEIRNLINEALSFGYHTAKDEAKGIPSAGYGTRFFDTYLIEQKLNIHCVSGKRPYRCANCQAELILYEVINDEIALRQAAVVPTRSEGKAGD
jgi:hypothetical protein